MMADKDNDSEHDKKVIINDKKNEYDKVRSDPNAYGNGYQMMIFNIVC